MKKIVSLLLALVMIFALAACGQSAAPAPAATEAPAAAEEPAAEPAPAEEAAPAEEPAPTPVFNGDELVVDTCILKEADDAMINNYTLLAVNPEAPFADADGNAVAVQIASGSADAGMGIYSAAKLYDLDFLPVCTEEYDLLIPTGEWESPKVRALIRALRSEEFRSRIEAMGGYTLEGPGEILAET